MKEIPLYGKHGEGRVAIVDDADYQRAAQYRWHVVSAIRSRTGKPRTWYAEGSVNGRRVRLHKFLHGESPSGKMWAFIQHHADRIDVRRSNLRLVPSRR